MNRIRTLVRTRITVIALLSSALWCLVLDAVPWSTRAIPATTPLKTRYATQGLTDTLLYITHGHSSSGYSGCKERTEAAPHDPLSYTCFIPTQARTEDPTLLSLIDQMNDTWYRALNLHTTFTFTRAEFYLAHNITRNWFGEFYLPVQKINLSHSWISTGIMGRSPIDQPVIQSLDHLLDAYDIGSSHGCCERRGACDGIISAGYTESFFCVGPFDYVDVTARLGILFPSGKRAYADWADEQFFGYEGHWGVPFNVTACVSLFQWFSAHGFAGIMPLVSRCEVGRTSLCDCSGCSQLRPLCTSVTEKGGTVLAAGLGACADHFFQGFSLDLAYRVDHQTRRSHVLSDGNGALLEQNTASFLQPWTRHSISACISYDFSCQESPHAPIIGIYAISTIGGRRVYKTALAGVYIGAQWLWCY